MDRILLYIFMFHDRPSIDHRSWINERRMMLLARTGIVSTFARVWYECPRRT